ncbi:hypothetical protein ACLMJK_008862 [Lecanora helva]
MLSQEQACISALNTLIESQPIQSNHLDCYHHLALQIQHNLQYQHDWTNLCIHTISPVSHQPLSRPLISGLAPHRIYVHPDDQIEELQKGVKDGDIEVEREWVLPTNLKEKWSLRKFAEIFDSIGEAPPKPLDETKNSVDHDDEKGLTEKMISQKRRGGKRVLLATISDDSTVVYYVVHDGIVKPRQN